MVIDDSQLTALLLLPLANCHLFVEGIHHLLNLTLALAEDGKSFIFDDSHEVFQQRFEVLVLADTRQELLEKTIPVDLYLLGGELLYTQ